MGTINVQVTREPRHVELQVPIANISDQKPNNVSLKLCEKIAIVFGRTIS